MPRAIIRPGVKMFNVSVRIKGGVTYQREVLNIEHNGSTEKKEIRTDVTVLDTEERERAEQVRSAARSWIVRQTTPTPFGNACEPANFDAIRLAIAQSRKRVADFNAGARFSRLTLLVFELDIPSNAEENARAITAAFAESIEKMSAAIDGLDPEKMREAADDAAKLLSVVEAEQAEIMGEAIAQVRKAARDVTRRIVKKGEDAIIVAKDIQRGAIERARLTFLDLTDDAPAPAADEATPLAQPAALDLSDDEPSEPALPAVETETDEAAETRAASATETWA